MYQKHYTYHMCFNLCGLLVKIHNHLFCQVLLLYFEQGQGVLDSSEFRDMYELGLVLGPDLIILQPLPLSKTELGLVFWPFTFSSVTVTFWFHCLENHRVKVRLIASCTGTDNLLWAPET